MDKDEMDKLYYTFQNELALQGVRALLYMNGGACIALLAFLPQAMVGNLQRNLWHLLPYVATALFFFALGVAAASAEYFVMYRCSVVFQGMDTASGLSPDQWRWLSRGLQVSIVALFVLGIITMSLGFVIGIK